MLPSPSLSHMDWLSSQTLMPYTDSWAATGEWGEVKGESRWAPTWLNGACASPAGACIPRYPTTAPCPNQATPSLGSCWGREDRWDGSCRAQQRQCGAQGNMAWPRAWWEWCSWIQSRQVRALSRLEGTAQTDLSMWNLIQAGRGNVWQCGPIQVCRTQSSRGSTGLIKACKLIGVCGAQLGLIWASGTSMGSVHAYGGSGAWSRAQAEVAQAPSECTVVGT